VSMLSPLKLVSFCAANERTFLHWLNIAVTVGSISAAMLGVSGHVHKHWGSDFTKSAMAARLLALMMMLTSIFIAAYATFLFATRASYLKCASQTSCSAPLHGFSLASVLTVQFPVV
jgi:uncharacterized membrane protein YidH (DUF202 family)